MGKILFIFISLFLLSSCLYEDKGNYDYNRLPDLEIWGVEENYGDRLLYTEYLKIVPEIKFSDEKDEAYSYAWYKKGKDKELVLISETKDLNYLPEDFGRNDFRGGSQGNGFEGLGGYVL